MDNARQSPHLRHRVIGEKPLRVAIQRQNEEKPSPGGELLDISAAGARLSLGSPLRFDERFELSLKVPEAGLSTNVACRVQWIRAGRSESEWTVGCAFETELDGNVLDQLVEQAILERRDSRREQVAIPVRVQWAPGAPEEKAELNNVSSGGFCVAAPGDIEIGRAVRIRFNAKEGGACLQGCVTWHSTSEKGTFVGCKWMDRQGAEWFQQRSAQGSKPAAQASEIKALPRRRSLAGRVALPLLMFVLGLQVGAYQFEIGRWIESCTHELQKLVAAHE